ncbi:RNA helicase [Rhizobium pusense]|uniref:RNA helicase n=1 Tax=Agrobacterium pusense TaxID=648995 RepID=A0A6H0ZTK4_9HYPH|nr:RNA helicase [Agrobacterium pusense]MDH2089143.1 RNA helicase [Agrobacterium pusense]QIX23110.1 RNA helicase [Agrobacterium pusense]WCK27314.1 RNA helicase [Agrobacterium pusense]
MIEIVGVQEGQEYEAALHVRRLLLDVWPDLGQSRRDIVKIFVGFKMYGQSVEDLDLVVVGLFDEPREFAVEYKFYPREGEPFAPRQAWVKNFALVIEVKSHDAGGVKFDDKVAFVRYSRSGSSRWECVTEKNRTQMFEFKKYLGRHGLDRVHVQDLILFTGLREVDLPERPHNCIAIDASFERWLNVLGQISRPHRSGNRVTLSFGADEVFEGILAGKFGLFEAVEPTPLDRKRMDIVAKKAVPDEWLNDLGKRQTILRGRGGVGKTVNLLQMAYRSYDQRQERSLLLTFNKALVADLRRTMALLGVPRSVENGGIAIETAHGFFGRVMLALGVISDYEGFLDDFESHKANLVEFLETGTISADDILGLGRNAPADFDWDLIFVDEGQDWPQDEIDILRRIFGSERINVSDGVDQFVRDSTADWLRGTPKGSVQSRRLKRSMRMKSNIATFASDVAIALGIADWDVEPNSDAAGGRVIVLEGDFHDQPQILHDLASEALLLGNHPVDMLVCVPPSMVRTASEEDLCSVADSYVKSGGRVWDGTSRDVREYFASHRDELRFVQYDSCRGLEAWTSINFGLDQLWDYKVNQIQLSQKWNDDLLSSKQELAAAHAARWIMIPLTRAMDTLVVNIGSRESFLKSALRQVYAKRGDFVQWMARS